jgi:hypothetical protein
VARGVRGSALIADDRQLRPAFRAELRACEKIVVSAWGDEHEACVRVNERSRNRRRAVFVGARAPRETSAGLGGDPTAPSRAV